MKEPAALLGFAAIISVGALLSAVPVSREWLRKERQAHPTRSVMREGALYGLLFALGQMGILGREVLVLAVPLGIALGIGWVVARRRRATSTLTE